MNSYQLKESNKVQDSNAGIWFWKETQIQCLRKYTYIHLVAQRNVMINLI
jgi:hypothetical protein